VKRRPGDAVAALRGFTEAGSDGIVQIYPFLGTLAVTGAGPVGLVEWASAGYRATRTGQEAL
jgi:hypothetical protein